MSDTCLKPVEKLANDSIKLVKLLAPDSRNHIYWFETWVAVIWQPEASEPQKLRNLNISYQAINELYQSYLLVPDDNFEGIKPLKLRSDALQRTEHLLVAYELETT